MVNFTEALVEATGLRSSDVRRIALGAPRKYKVYYIEKRSGGKRQIAQPTREVKYLQRAAMASILCHLPVHKAATAYRTGLSIRDNALPHAKSGPILKLDFKEFFPSIRSRDWRRYCHDFALFEDADDIALSERLLFFREKGAHELKLSIGAPSSPMLSNILMYEFDRSVTEAVSKDKVIYTRYADDMTFSGPRTGHLVNVKRQVAQIIRKMDHPRLDLNDAKTTYITKKFHRTVTGLTISNDGRVTIGREEKRMMNAGIHNAARGTLTDDQIKALAGKIAYANAVEPRFVELLRKKYGADTIRLICQLSGLLSPTA